MALDVADGRSLLVGAVQNDVPVFVFDDWLDQVDRASARHELQMSELAEGRADQIMVTRALSGLVVRVPRARH